MTRIYHSYGQHRQEDVMSCKSCDATRQERRACARCKGPGCANCLIENEVSEKLCENCTAIESNPQIQAAQKAAHSGSYHDLHKYVEERKRAI